MCILIVLLLGFTALEHRRKEVANLFTKWVLNRADEIGLEIWVDASPPGQPVYEKLRFIPYKVDKVSPVMPPGYTAEQKAEWEKMEKDILPIESITMWRPKGGRFVEVKQ